MKNKYIGSALAMLAAASMLAVYATASEKKYSPDDLRSLSYYLHGSTENAVGQDVNNDGKLDQNDIVYSRKACYAHGEYKIYKCPEEITLDELALICDGGNLCFGYSGSKTFLSVSED